MEKRWKNVKNQWGYKAKKDWHAGGIAQVLCQSEKKVSIVDSWTTQKLGVPMPQTVENPCTAISTSETKKLKNFSPKGRKLKQLRQNQDSTSNPSDSTYCDL